MGFAAELVMDNQNKLGVVVLSNTVDAPVYFNHSQSISRNLYEMVGRVLMDPNSFDRPLLMLNMKISIRMITTGTTTLLRWERT